MQSPGGRGERVNGCELKPGRKFSVSVLYHTIANYLAARFMACLFGAAGRIHVLNHENAEQRGGFLLASNHISHFDPLIISGIVRRKIDWMAMSEFFRYPLVGLFLRAVDAFPADRDRANRATIQSAMKRLRDGRIVGLFPEGGIRDGARSLLEGAPFRSGASALASHTKVPILPCVILGSDRFYAKKSWRPWRRTPLWIAFGKPIAPFSQLDKENARARGDAALAAAFQDLYLALRKNFSLQPDDLPHSPRERMQSSANSRAGSIWRRATARTIDAAMCASMNLMQSRHRLHAASRAEMERYVTDCEKISVHDYYSPPESDGLFLPDGNKSCASVGWRSPIETKFPANNMARADFYLTRAGWSAPTVFLLHAFMSVSDVGYRRWAARLNELGWNACFVHLPYHYSRVPRDHWNGELAITADLIRIAEGLRQGVMELRQLMSAMRALGGTKFGVIGTSYGGWIGALLATVESDFRFVALLAPILNMEHAVWESPATIFMRRELRRAGIERALIARHFHLSSPLHNEPLCPAEHVLFVAGEFDSIARAADVEALHQKWRGSDLLRVRQGHFGYRMFPETVARLKERAMFE